MRRCCGREGHGSGDMGHRFVVMRGEYFQFGNLREEGEWLL